ncbi:unnamed protein product [Paramecium pentaurelia]|uniref:EGF-like domain-containing protein n=1 Tax=Paramecium pentaurelia TaxID=43138 RepID=A0A8S1X4F8_9CILI|nr:unnamed protein product [Paramecium pentaurelia]
MQKRGTFLIGILPLSCPDGQYFTAGGGGCSNLCLPICTTCSDGTSCDSCSVSNPYLLLPSRVCTTCPTGCLTCDLSSCLSCDTGYYQSTLCIQCPTECSLCSSSTICSACNSGYYLSGSSCLSCTLPSVHCGSPCNCSSGSYLVGSCCYPCQAPCSECSGSATFCTSCVDSTNQSTSTCDCTLPTKYLNALNNCSDCASPCVNCSSLSSCSSCINTYYLQGTSCQACTSPCVNCNTSSTDCTSCIDSAHQTTPTCACVSGYIKNTSNDMCTACTFPCATCQNTIIECHSCASTYQYDSSAHTCTCLTNQYEDNGSPKECQNCSLPCTKCTSPTVCTECNDVSHQVLNDCHCIDTYYMDSSSVCQLCISPCLNCSSNSVCTSCINNYYLDSPNCLQCSLPCYNCVDIDTKCTSCAHSHQTVQSDLCVCDDGYYMDGSYYCQLCTHPCSKCTSTSTYCTDCASTFISSGSNTCVCDDGYYEETLNSPSDCQPCTSPCVKCEIESTHCITCIDINQTVDPSTYQCLCNIGWVANGNLCDQCQLPCTKCITTQDTCTECLDPNHLIINNKCVCKSGYGQSGLNSNYCSICEYPCLECSINVNTCTKCIDSTLFTFILLNNECICDLGYFLNNENNCIACIEFCLECIDQFSCEVCIDGYYYESTLCNKCSNNCKTCSNQNDFCLSCNNNYNLINNQCICGLGYYLQNDTCQKCKYPCIECSNDTTCIQCAQIDKLSMSDQQTCICQDGYYWSISQCLLCHLNCLTCQETSTKCLSCDLSLNKRLQNNQCNCILNYYLSDQNTCNSCDSEQGKVIQSCKYKNCNDQVWTYGEDCDDGNQIQGDGCSNCKIDKNYICTNTIMQKSLCYSCPQFCISCQQNSITNQNECVKCQSGYYLDQNICQICDKQCKECETNPSNCTNCRFIQSASKKCKLCEYKQGYYSDYSTNTCYNKCGDSIIADSEQCDDGNQINGDGCNNKCLMEKNFICLNDTCITPNYPIPKLSIFGSPQRYEKERKFKLEYNVPLLIVKSNFELSSELKFYIENRSGDVQLLNYPYTFIQNMTLVENSYYSYEAIITLQLNQSSQYQIFNIYFLDPSKIQSYQGYEQKIDHVKAAVEEYVYVDESTQSLTETFNSLSINLFYIILILLAVSILFGGLDIFYNLLDTIQLLSYLKYINLQFPYNLQTYFEIFGFAQLSFIQNYLNIEDFFSNYISLEELKPLPKKIQDDNYSSIYLVNVSQILVVYGTLFGLYSMAIIIPLTIKQVRFKYYEENPEKQAFTLKLKIYFLSIKIFIGEMCKKVVNELFYSGILRTFMATAYDYSFIMVLQIYTIDINSNSFLLQFSSLISLLAFILYIIICLVIIYLLGKNKLSLKQNNNIEKFGSIIEGIKIKNNYQKYFNVVLLVKKLMFMVILIFCYEDPLSQTVNLFLLSITTALYLFHHKPNEDKNEYIKQLSTEINLCLTYIFIIFLIVNDQIKKLNNKEQSYIGWICIVLITSIILIQLIIDLIQQWRMLLKKFATLRRFINKISNMFKKKAESTTPDKNVFEEIQNHEFYQSIILYK